MGSEFIVRLQHAEARPSHEARPAPDKSAVPAMRRVLVVDDNHDAADSLGMMLQFLGSDVHIVYDGEAALQALDSYKPALVLLDIGMPGMDGYDVARQIRQHPEARDVTLIALTGWGQPDDRRRARRAGFDDHLTKPLDMGALQRALAALNRPRRERTRAAG